MALLILFTFISAAEACPACKEAVASDGKLTQGFARSIHLMMAMPYLLFAGVAFLVVRSARRSKPRG